ILLFLFGGYLLFGGGVDKIHWLSIKNQWKGQKVVYYKNSIYGNVSVVEREKQYTFFTDGIPTITTPTPDIVFVEEFVHLPMLSHQSPEEILVLSGGAGGVIGEILKYRSVKKIDYAELDPLLLKAVKKFPTPLTQSELENQKVDIQNIDGRLFIQRTQKLYDLIFVGVSNPTDLQVNRMFTKEFFVLAKKKLKPGGVFVIGLPGSLTSLSKELKNLNGCILNTLRSIYPSIRIIPGDFNLFLASNSEEITLINETLLSKRLEERELRTNLLTKGHLKYKLDKRRLEWFLSSLNQERKINSDFIPLAVFHSLAYRNALFSPYIQKWFQWFEKINLKQIIFFLAIFTLSFIFICSRIKGSLKIAVPLAILFTGFAGMLFDLILVFTFQVLCGYVFYQIGLLVTALMVGTTVGSGLMTFFLERIKKSIPFFMKVELSIILFSGILPVIFLILHPHLENRSVFFLTQVSFLVLSFISGFLIGVQFPLAAMIHSRFSPKLGTTAGLLYGADLFGGYIGGVIGGIVLLPILGLVKTCFVVAMVKISSLIIFIFSSQRFT
ncbi:MAG TPA: spermine synthase, partial [Nitrospinota bacterium]|nr:spermine synthase [Nitrospinota bacterium]